MDWQPLFWEIIDNTSKKNHSVSAFKYGKYVYQFKALIYINKHRKYGILLSDSSVKLGIRNKKIESGSQFCWRKLAMLVGMIYLIQVYVEIMHKSIKSNILSAVIHLIIYRETWCILKLYSSHCSFDHFIPNCNLSLLNASNLVSLFIKGNYMPVIINFYLSLISH